MFQTLQVKQIDRQMDRWMLRHRSGQSDRWKSVWSDRRKSVRSDGWKSIRSHGWKSSQSGSPDKVRQMLPPSKSCPYEQDRLGMQKDWENTEVNPVHIHWEWPCKMHKAEITGSTATTHNGCHESPGLLFFSCDVSVCIQIHLASQGLHDAAMWPSHSWNPIKCFQDCCKLIGVSTTGYRKTLRVREPIWSGPLNPRHYSDKHRGVQEYQH
jgi:hypothetical protein